MSDTPQADEMSQVNDEFWQLFGAFLVFFMQCGFALLEAGSVRAKNTKNILLKNVMDACIGSIVWYIIGYPLAYGKDVGHFIGGSWDVLAGKSNDYAAWMFQWAFAATAATIVSGAVAERCKFSAYVIYTVLLTGFVYPVIAHWYWGGGWLATELEGGFKDFAGSGIVHMTGGGAALMGAIFIGARHGRFGLGTGDTDMPGHSSVLAVLGTFILWFGWYGFNGVSTLSYSAMGTASRVCVTTTLSAAAGGATGLFLYALHHNSLDLTPALNGILGGLVGITAGCDMVQPYAAIVIGCVSGLVYYYSAAGLKWLRVDDPLDASPIHFFCGMWGVISVGLLTDDSLDSDSCGILYGCTGTLLWNQLAGVVAIAAWTCTLSGLLFFTLGRLDLLRVPLNEELEGLDVSHHGGQAYHFSQRRQSIGSTEQKETYITHVPVQSNAIAPVSN
mmetsp:Transcript_6332/g.15206  ORF Transcript_6332/g.15206 Transcript_6332/m.15206 type:complete len:446 (-) Transcript_6332:352-1689(-)